MPRVAVIVADLMFQPRIANAARAIGYDVDVADAPEPASAALASSPDLAIIDLHGPFDAAALIRAAKTAGARVIAFGRHTEPDTLRAARVAGADRAIARSQLVEDLSDLLREASGAPTTD